MSVRGISIAPLRKEPDDGRDHDRPDDDAARRVDRNRAAHIHRIACSYIEDARRIDAYYVTVSVRDLEEVRDTANDIMHR